VARARTEATGAAGTATAEALSGGGRFTVVSGVAEAPVFGNAVVAARADATGVLSPAALDGSVDAFAFVTATGESPDVWGRGALGLFDRQGIDDDDLRRHSDDGDLRRHPDHSDILLHSDDDDILLRSEAVFANPSLNLGSLENLVVSFLSVEVGDEDFEELRFRIRNGETTLVDEDFDEADDAVDFFQRTLELALGPGVVTLDLHFVLELESESAGSGFSTLFALGTTVIPEPSTGALLALGLLLIAVRRARCG
jgi:hypothetical protein